MQIICNVPLQSTTCRSVVSKLLTESTANGSWARFLAELLQFHGSGFFISNFPHDPLPVLEVTEPTCSSHTHTTSKRQLWPMICQASLQTQCLPPEGTNTHTHRPTTKNMPRSWQRFDQLSNSTLCYTSGLANVKKQHVWAQYELVGGHSQWLQQVVAFILFWE